MLRWVMGDRAFFEGLQRYYARHAGGSVVTEDFQAVMEEAYGYPLAWFFDAWLRRPGYPIYRTSWSWIPERGVARVSIEQAQDPTWPTFRMPIEVEFQLDGGVHRATQWVDGRLWEGEILVPALPTAMRFDPDGWLLSREERLSGP
jgi:aminopeptidase N